MDQVVLRTLLEEVRDSRVSPDQAIHQLRHLPFEDVGFAKIDHHRPLRVGMPEVIYSAGKTPEQVAEIFVRMAEWGSNVLATRANREKFEAVHTRVPQAEFHPASGCIVLRRGCEKRGRGLVLVICAGTSDIPVAEEAAVTADLMGNEVEQLCDVGVAPAGWAFTLQLPKSNVPNGLSEFRMLRIEASGFCRHRIDGVLYGCND